MIDGLELGARIGAGKSTEVFEAVRTTGGEHVAVRVVQPWIVERARRLDPAFLDRFRAATHARAQAHSPHLIEIDRVGESAEGVFVVTELVRGRRVSDVLGARHAWQLAFAILEQLCDAFTALRSVGVTSGGPLPTKIYFMPQGRSEIIKLDSLFIDLPPTFALEPLRSDVSALGALGYHLIAGQLPDPQRPAHLTDVPQHVDDVIMCCLAPQRGARFADLDALREALRDSAS